MKAFEGNDHEEVWFGLEQEFTWVAKQDFDDIMAAAEIATVLISLILFHSIPFHSIPFHTSLFNLDER
jgi:hypothetical protein